MSNYASLQNRIVSYETIVRDKTLFEPEKNAPSAIVRDWFTNNYWTTTTLVCLILFYDTKVWIICRKRGSHINLSCTFNDIYIVLHVWEEAALKACVWGPPAGQSLRVSISFESKTFICCPRRILFVETVIYHLAFGRTGQNTLDTLAQIVNYPMISTPANVILRLTWLLHCQSSTSLCFSTFYQKYLHLPWKYTYK